MLHGGYAHNVTRPSTMAMRIEPVRISILQVLFRACACGRKRSLAFRATKQKHMSKLYDGCLHVVLLVGSQGAKSTKGFRTEQLSTRVESNVLVPALIRGIVERCPGYGDGTRNPFQTQTAIAAAPRHSPRHATRAPIA